MKDTVTRIFESFTSQGLIFRSKDVLQLSYVPDSLPHRENQIEQLASMLAPALRMEVPSNILIYGKPGTGKTATVKFVGSELERVAADKGMPVRFIYVNAGLKKLTDTEYRLYAHLSNLLGRPFPHTGLPTSQALETFLEAVDDQNAIVILVIDEMDTLVSKNPDVLYTLSRMNSELRKSKVSLIGITNDLGVLSSADARTRSSMSEEDLIFSPYNADQIADILKERSVEAFFEDVLGSESLLFVAAHAAQSHGDARRALELLRVSGELAERAGKQKVEREFVLKAIEKLDSDHAVSVARTLPQHNKIILKAILNMSSEPPLFTGDIYEEYEKMAAESGLGPLTLRRVSDILNEFDSMGLISSKIISRGRYGRTRAVSTKNLQSIKKKLKGILASA